MSAFSLKLIAAALMLFDHSEAIFTALLPHLSLGVLKRAVGRASCPVFAFLIAEGAYYTHDLKRFFLRMTLFALISEIPFNLFYTFTALRCPLVFYPSEQNVLFTWAFAIFGIFCVKKAVFFLKRAGPPDNVLMITPKYKNKTLPAWVNTAFILRLRAVLYFVLALSAAAAAELLRTDYGGLGVLMVFGFYFTRAISKPAQLAAGAAVISALYWRYPIYVVFAGFALILIALYNNKQGIRAKYFFYVFYPAHLTALWLFCAYALPFLL